MNADGRRGRVRFGHHAAVQCEARVGLAALQLGGDHRGGRAAQRLDLEVGGHLVVGGLVRVVPDARVAARVAQQLRHVVAAIVDGTVQRR